MTELADVYRTDPLRLLWVPTNNGKNGGTRSAFGLEPLPSPGTVDNKVDGKQSGGDEFIMYRPKRSKFKLFTAEEEPPASPDAASPDSRTTSWLERLLASPLDAKGLSGAAILKAKLKEFIDSAVFEGAQLPDRVAGGKVMIEEL